MVKEIEVILERDGKPNSWMRVDGTDFISLKIQLVQEKEEGLSGNKSVLLGLGHSHNFN
jgi:hypothetical protein